MIALVLFIIYGFIVGSLAKWLHPTEDVTGFWPTVVIGIAGSYIGGFINWVLGMGGLFDSSGLIMGVVGGVICCYAYAWYRVQKFVKENGRKPLWRPRN